MNQISNNQIQDSFKKLFQAKNELLIASPFISPNYLADLIDISKTNVKIKLITSLGNDNFYRSTLWILDNIQNKPNFKFKIIQKLHAKIYISDNNFAIHGSANLTEAGLKSNIEQISILKEKNDIDDLKKVFEDIWKNGIEKEIKYNPKLKNTELKRSKKEKAINDAKNFILKKYVEISIKGDLLFQTRELLRAYHHLGEVRLENYLKIAISDLKIKHNVDLDKEYPNKDKNGLSCK